MPSSSKSGSRLSMLLSQVALTKNHQILSGMGAAFGRTLEGKYMDVIIDQKITATRNNCKASDTRQMFREPTLFGM